MTDSKESSSSPGPRERRQSMIDDRQAGFGLSYREQKLEPPVPVHERKCTDLLFLLIFCMYWLGILAIAAVGKQNGDPRRLVFGSDSNGIVCGGDLKPDQPYVAFPRVSEDAFVQATTLKNPLDALSFFSVCVETCPVRDEIVCSDEASAALDAETDGSESQREAKALACVADKPFNLVCPTSNSNNNLIKEGCFITLFDSEPVLFRCLPRYDYNVTILEDESGCQEYRNVTKPLFPTGSEVVEVCAVYKQVTKITTVEPTASDILFDSFNTAARVFQRYLGDIEKAKYVILLAGLGFATFGGFVYIVSLFC